MEKLEPIGKSPMGDVQRVKIYVGQGVYLSIIQGPGTYSNHKHKATTAEIAIIENGQVHEPEGWCNISDLMRIARKAQRIANKRQAQFEATPDYLKPLWKGDSNGD